MFDVSRVCIQCLKTGDGTSPVVPRLFSWPVTSDSLRLQHPRPPVPCEVKVRLLSRVRLFATPWTVAYQASLSLGFSRQEYWSGLPFPSPGALPDPGIKPGSPAPEADALTFEPPGKPLSLTISQSLPKLRSVAWVMPSSHLIL